MAGCAGMEGCKHVDVQAAISSVNPHGGVGSARVFCPLAGGQSPNEAAIIYVLTRNRWTPLCQTFL